MNSKENYTRAKLSNMKNFTQGEINMRLNFGLINKLLNQIKLTRIFQYIAENVVEVIEKMSTGEKT